MSTGLATQNFTQGERFTQAVIKEFGASVGELQVSAFQKKLAQNYFIKLDASLREAERKRLVKNSKTAENFQENVAVTWENVNMQKLAQEVVAYTSVGLDPLQPNHINLIPYKNNGTGKYDIGFVMGYRGIELKAKRYGLEVPDEIIIEIVHSTDTFKQFKRDKDNNVESYTFVVNDDFNRGEVVGGFYYFSYANNPTKNRLVVLSIKDILKRKPEYASAEFWGGETEKWIKKEGESKATKQKVTIEGWYEEMCWKTVARAAYNSITIDSAKIDEHLMAVIAKELESHEQPSIKQEIQDNANKQILDVEEQGHAEDVTEQPAQIAPTVQQQPIQNQQQPGAQQSQAEIGFDENNNSNANPGGAPF